jgi:hypothetical protein
MRNCLKQRHIKGEDVFLKWKGKELIPINFIGERQYSESMESVKRMIPVIALNLNKIQVMICDIPVISDIQKRYYQTIIRTRYEKILYPIFEKLRDRGSDYHEDSYLDEER